MSGRTEHRLVAVMAADMVGYSALTEANEAGTIARQKAHRAELFDPAIAAHGGRLISTAGDSLLVEFASVVDAVDCAVTARQAGALRETALATDRRMASLIPGGVSSPCVATTTRS